MFSDKTIAFHTLGCKLNFAETSAITRQMEAVGFETVDFTSKADVYVINTCSVTDDADAKCRNIVRRSLKNNPNAFVVVLGCYAQLKPNEIASIEGVDLVLGAKDKFRLPNIITDLTKNACGQVFTSDIHEVNVFMPSFSLAERTRSFLKIQDGCDYKCSFCTIPLARGKSRSDSLENILNNAKALAANGIKEIVLTGVNTGDYGKGIEDEIGLIDVVKHLEQIEEIERFRISSVEPNLMTDEIIDFIANSKKFMPHFHMPLQSGSDRILGLMQRRYKSALYAEKVAKIKSILPDACIGVDVIVGFPGETEEDFMETFNFIHSIDASYLHVFTYSERANTKALEMENPVPMQERHDRCIRLRNLSEKKKRHFYEQFLNSNRKVLFEDEQRGELMHGFTDNYIKVNAPYDKSLCNTIQEVSLNGFSEDGNINVNVNQSILI
ncbi:MAG TPA: tRNA (N(6)-L-threonylcarbamoyladenosine(37)-C(2))-methylthiotransferase MtaB [Chitinophagales bacterium]|nr:tRNA (N(6)-L-threonylcarbamoyladenosine(37)-C(2))-methylthiotransferase MtaB [Chitinophagales bacterium]HMU98533.1 tRNA (N(6)-L-threonylcarbamoyladenosine(37)-C(2))-methylthiotransferase MtaB [Chitinophagales bacterium]HMV03415.1 tRNA (N(6)-L-threonylcarbamoyladenosine(37)-C(2))-methylthiotransferase MtaB [Chitinophagales bacterium]HMW95193.1 tRNA (N(6)-L-threonylcarbamoyladenosine(37)-C(2))-methylthiotransferase MtaB [Chitinophagales bacterium]HMY43174.1 tRNA (N(6)-L-threonylcarbamoyladenos